MGSWGCPAFVLLLASCAGPDLLPPERTSDAARDWTDYARAFFPGEAPPRCLSIIETLRNPVRAAGWTGDEILFEDGRRLHIEGSGDPANAAAMAWVTKHGFEVKGASVVGLLRTWPECGLHPVVFHLARVEVPDLLRYLAERPSERSFFPGHGWSEDSLQGYRRWREARRLPAPAPRVLRRGSTSKERLVVLEGGEYWYGRGDFAFRGRTVVWRGWLPHGLRDLLDEEDPHHPLESVLDWLRARHS